jgi:hypothetical protein
MIERCVFVLLLGGCLLGLTMCGSDEKRSRMKDGSSALPPSDTWKENSAAIKAIVIRAEMRNPYDYTLHLRVDSVLAIEGDNVLLHEGDSIAALPDFTYLAPGILDMRWQANQSLTSLARVLRGQKLIVLVALAENGKWMLEEGKRE